VSAPARLIPEGTTIPDSTRCLCYVRVSTEDQARADCVSLDQQQQDCTRFALARGYPAPWTIRDTQSGRSLTRPGFVALQRFCQSHPRPATARGLVVAWDSSRWGRFHQRPSLARTIEDQLWLAGWDLEFVKQPSTGTDADAYLRLAGGQASAEESRRIASRASMGMVSQARAGCWQGRPPFAFARVARAMATGTERTLAPYEQAAKGERVRLVPGNPGHVRTVREIFRRFVAGASRKAIADALNATHTPRTPGPWTIYPNPGNVTWWTPSTVKAILTNAAYVGDVVFNRLAPKDDQGHRPTREAGAWIVTHGAHPALIERATWEAAQRRLTPRGLHRPEASPYLLTGMVTCTTCGNLVTGGGGSRAKAPDPSRFMFYRCRGAVRYPATCTDPILTVNKNFLEDAVLRAVTRHVERAVRSSRWAKALNAALGTPTEERPAPTRDERHRLLTQRDRIVDFIADGKVTKVQAKARLDAIEEALAALDQQPEPAPSPRPSKAQREQLRQAALNFGARLAAASPATARELLAQWVEGITVNKADRTACLIVRTLPAGCFSLDSPAGPGAGRSRRPR
jgi:site-specific DNA recombinase